MKKSLVITTLVTLGVLCSMSTQAFAYRKIKCDSAEAKKFTSNLLAKKLKKRKLYATPAANKLTWPYYTHVFDMRSKVSEFKTFYTSGFNQSFLVIHPRKTLKVGGTVNSGSAQITTCTYRWKGRGLKVAKYNELKLVTQSKVRKLPSTASGSKMVANTTMGRVTLVYVSPKSSARFTLSVISGGNR